MVPDTDSDLMRDEMTQPHVPMFDTGEIRSTA